MNKLLTILIDLIKRKIIIDQEFTNLYYNDVFFYKFCKNIEQFYRNLNHELTEEEFCEFLVEFIKELVKVNQEKNELLLKLKRTSSTIG